MWIDQAVPDTSAGCEIHNSIKPIVQSVYTNDATAKNVANHLLNGFADWVEGCHPYRHGQQSEEVFAPPLEIAVATLSNGATYIRWLMELDERVNG